VTEQQAIAAQAGAHRVRTGGQRLPQMSNEEGYARGIEDTILEPSSVPKASVAKQKNTTWLYERSKADAQFKAGNKGHQKQTQVARWEEEEEEEIFFEEVLDKRTGKVTGYNAYQNGKPVVPASQRGYVEIITDEVGRTASNSKISPTVKAPEPVIDPIFEMGPRKPYAAELGADTAFEAMMKDGSTQLKRIANSATFRGDAVGTLLDYGATGVRALGKGVGIGGSVVMLHEAYYDYYLEGNYYKAGQLVVRGVVSGVGASVGAIMCSPSRIPTLISACGLFGAGIGDGFGFLSYENVIWPTTKFTMGLYQEYMGPGAMWNSLNTSEYTQGYTGIIYGPTKPMNFNYHPYQ
jgi:hypothetical protein